MRVTKWVDMGAEVEVEIGADDIGIALSEAFSAANQQLEKAVNIHDVLRAINNIAGFLKGISDENIGRFNDKQREFISNCLIEQGERFKQEEPKA